MFDTADKASCPMCRTQARKKLLCTFDCVRAKSESRATACNTKSKHASPPSSKFYGSKIASLISAIQQILDSTSDDKVLVFGQWEVCNSCTTACTNDPLLTCRTKGLLTEIANALASNQIPAIALSVNNMALV
jgi:hypothetical protein